MKRFIHCLVILAFLTVGISPACKFISGQMVDLEICTPEGLQTIQIAADKTPEPQKPQKHQKTDDCAFCFAQTHLKLAKAEPPAFQAPAAFKTSCNHLQQAARYATLHSSAQPRAPPVIS